MLQVSDSVKYNPGKDKGKERRDKYMRIHRPAARAIVVEDMTTMMTEAPFAHAQEDDAEQHEEGEEDNDATDRHSRPPEVDAMDLDVDDVAAEEEKKRKKAEKKAKKKEARRKEKRAEKKRAKAAALAKTTSKKRARPIDVHDAEMEREAHARSMKRPHIAPNGRAQKRLPPPPPPSSSHADDDDEEEEDDDMEEEEEEAPRRGKTLHRVSHKAPRPMIHAAIPVVSLDAGDDDDDEDEEEEEEDEDEEDEDETPLLRQTAESVYKAGIGDIRLIFKPFWGLKTTCRNAPAASEPGEWDHNLATAMTGYLALNETQLRIAEVKEEMPALDKDIETVRGTYPTSIPILACMHDQSHIISYSHIVTRKQLVKQFARDLILADRIPDDAAHRVLLLRARLNTDVVYKTSKSVLPALVKAHRTTTVAHLQEMQTREADLVDAAQHALLAHKKYDVMCDTCGEPNLPLPGAKVDRRRCFICSQFAAPARAAMGH